MLYAIYVLSCLVFVPASIRLDGVQFRWICLQTCAALVSDVTVRLSSERRHMSYAVDRVAAIVSAWWLLSTHYDRVCYFVAPAYTCLLLGVGCLCRQHTRAFAVFHIAWHATCAIGLTTASGTLTTIRWPLVILFGILMSELAMVPHADHSANVSYTLALVRSPLVCATVNTMIAIVILVDMDIGQPCGIACVMTFYVIICPVYAHLLHHRTISPSTMRTLTMCRCTLASVFAFQSTLDELVWVPFVTFTMLCIFHPVRVQLWWTCIRAVIGAMWGWGALFPCVCIYEIICNESCWMLAGGAVWMISTVRYPYMRDIAHMGLAHSVTCEGTQLHSDSGKATLYALHPHGIFPVSILFLSTHPRMVHARCAVASTLLRLPVMRLMDTFLRAFSARDLETALVAKQTVVIIPGGFEEAALNSSTEERVYLNGRAGFLKVCLRTGAQVVPVYAFGESCAFDSFQGLRRLRMWLARRGVPITPFWGVRLLPWMPRDVPVRVVVGTPIPVEHIPMPSNDDVARVHDAYVEAVRALYYEHRSSEDPEDLETIHPTPPRRPQDRPRVEAASNSCSRRWCDVLPRHRFRLTSPDSILTHCKTPSTLLANVKLKCLNFCFIRTGFRL